MLLCDCGDSSDELRELAAAIIMSDPKKYNSAFLGRSNQDYVQWLRKKESWGGEEEGRERDGGRREVERGTRKREGRRRKEEEGREGGRAGGYVRACEGGEGVGGREGGRAGGRACVCEGGEGGREGKKVGGCV